MLVDLPPPPAPVTPRLEVSVSLPVAPPPYEYRMAGEGEAPPEAVPVRQAHQPAVLPFASGQFRQAFGKHAVENPINLVLSRLGSSFRALVLEIWNENGVQILVTGTSDGGESGGLGDGSPAPVPPGDGDPIPVGGGGGPNGG